ncbi:MAG: DUF2975 domain-containing protein [bacterium]|nr:DUF2975 domain-containing protein [bacterium]
MKRGSTLFLKIVVCVLALIALAVLTFAMWLTYNVEGGGAEYRPIVIGMFVGAIPFLIALWQSMKLLILIEKGTAFSDLAVDALKKIKYCGIAISIIVVLGSPYIIGVAHEDDAPGVVLIGLIIAFTSAVIATFAALLQKLLKNVIDIKSENELTV